MNGWAVVAWVWGGSAVLLAALAVWEWAHDELAARRARAAARVSGQVGRVAELRWGPQYPSGSLLHVCPLCQLRDETDEEVGPHSLYREDIA